MARTFSTAALAILVVIALQLGGVAQQLPRVPADLAASGADGAVRVIVRLAVPPPSDAVAAGDPRALEVHRAAIASAQDAVLDALPGLAEAATRFDTLPAFAVTTDAAGLARLAELPSVAAIELDHLLAPALVDTPGIVSADKLWAQGTEGSGWTVAVLDTGVETSHSFFSGRVIHEACYSTENPSLNASSLCPSRVTASIQPGSGTNCVGFAECGHGTAVAGIAAGRNDLFSGIARRASLAAIQVFTSFRAGSDVCGGNTSPSCLKAYTSNVISGLERVAAIAGPTNGGRIAAVNLSLVREDYVARPDPEFAPCDSANQTMADAITNLWNLGIPTIVASGHNGSPFGLPFPACISTAVAVAASSKPDPSTGAEALALFSNRSIAFNNLLVAPGLHVYTSLLGDSYGEQTGTSVAAPHVAGAWALLKSLVPGASVPTALQALRGTGVLLNDPATGFKYPRIVVNKAAGSLGPAGSPTAVRVSTIGSNLTLEWADPFDGSTPEFHVEFLSTSGALLGVVNVARAHILATTLPNGSFLVRVRSVNGGVRGVASNEVPFTIGSLPIFRAPSVPDRLRAIVDGQTVSLYWNLPVDSAPADAFLIEVGSASGLSNFGTFDTGSPALSLIARNVNPGTYFVRLRARNAFGVSAPSNEIRVDVSGTGCAAIQPPSGLNATVVGNLVTLNWNPPVQVGAVIGYTIEAGTAPGLSNVVSAATGPQTVVAATAAPGIYYVRVHARSASCGQTGPSNEVVVVVP